MNPDGMPTPEEFLKHVRKTQEAMVEARALSWLAAKKTIEFMLDQANFEEGTTARTALFTLLQASWVQGYNTGAQDLSRYMMRNLGLGSVVDQANALQTLGEKLSQTKPENN
jgi:hypothetical protein